MQVKTREFNEAASTAIQDEKIQANLLGLYGGFHQARLDASAATTNWDELQDRGRAIKAHTIANLDVYLRMAEENVRKAGGKVFFAKDSDEATRYVTELAKAKSVKTVVKSKSMVSEEMGLNERLEEAGIESVETDLGEYIIQLAGEAPFHIIAPAIHKSREDVAELFEDKLDRPYNPDIDELAQEARRQLREKFIAADMGITGANFIVAETGTLVLVTNEGNGRMCTSMPRIHVAITGMEKVVPSIEDMGIMLRLLIRSATGQRISSYVTAVTGPRRADDEDGPEEFHLVIVDNGRSRLLADPDLREALYCLRCGACLNACPVYRKVGGHSYGWVYPGPIGAIVSPMLTNLVGREGLAIREQPVRGVQGGVSGEDKLAAHAAVSAAPARGGREVSGASDIDGQGAAGYEGLAAGVVESAGDGYCGRYWEGAAAACGEGGWCEVAGVGLDAV